MCKQTIFTAMAKRGLQYTPRKRAAIIALHKEGFSIREIESRGYGRKSAIANMIRKYCLQGSTSPRKRRGRPRVSSSSADRVLGRLVKKNRFMGSQELASEWNASTGVTANARTVRRRLFNSGMKSHRPATKPLLSKFQRLRRLTFAKKYSAWSIEDWKKVMAAFVILTISVSRIFDCNI